MPYCKAPRGAPRGATLTELIAALVVLGTIFSSALIARGRFQRQLRAADETLRAVRAAEELIGRWLSQPAGTAPVPGQGTLEGSTRLIWRTRWVSDRAVQRLGVRMARLEIVDSPAARHPIVKIEFLLPPAQAPTTQEAPK